MVTDGLQLGEEVRAICGARSRIGAGLSRPEAPCRRRPRSPTSILVSRLPALRRRCGPPRLHFGALKLAHRSHGIAKVERMRGDADTGKCGPVMLGRLQVTVKC